MMSRAHSLRWTLPKVLYMIVRYYGLALLLLVSYLWIALKFTYHSPRSDAICELQDHFPRRFNRS